MASHTLTIVRSSIAPNYVDILLDGTYIGWHSEVDNVPKDMVPVPGEEYVYDLTKRELTMIFCTPRNQGIEK